MFPVSPGTADIQQIQPQGVGDHAEAAQAHGRCADHGTQGEAEGGDQSPGGQGDSDAVVEKGPEQVLLDVPQYPAGEPDGSGDIRRSGFHEHHVRRIQRNIRACSDGDADVRPGEGGGVVDTVSHHGHLPVFLKAADDGFLIPREHIGNHTLHADAGGNSPGGAAVISRQEQDPDAHGLQLFDGGGAVLLYLVRHRGNTQRTACQGEEQRRFARLGELCPGGFQGRSHQAHFLEIGGAGTQGFMPSQHSPDPVAGQSLEALHDRKIQTLRFRPVPDGPCKGMLAGGLQRCGCGQKLLPGDPGSGEQIRHLRLALGDGAGFVQHDDIRPSGGFQSCGGFEENAVFRAFAAADHDGHGRGQTQGAGTADHQNAHCPGQGEAESPSGNEPDRTGNEGKPQDNGYEYGAHPVCHFGDGGFARGGGLHQVDDLPEGGVRAYPGRPTGQSSILVQGGGADPAAGSLVHRQAFPSKGRFIHGALSGDHFTVHGDAFSGPDQEEIVHPHLLRGDLDLRPVPQDAGGFRRQIHQTADGVGGPALAPGFQQLAHGDEGEDHRGGFKIVVRFASCGSQTEQDRCAVGEGGAAAQGHQGVHIGRSVSQAFEAANEKPLVHHHDGGAEDQFVNADGEHIVAQERRNGPAPHMMAHGNVHQRQEKDQGDYQPPEDLRALCVLQRRSFRLGVRGGCRGCGKGSAVTRIRNSPADAVRRFPILVPADHH